MKIFNEVVSQRSMLAFVSVEVRRLCRIICTLTLTDFTLHFCCCFTELLYSLFIPLLDNFTCMKSVLKRFTQMFFLQSYSPMLTSANYPLGNNLFHPVLTLLLYSCPASVSESSFHCSCADVCCCKSQRCY